MSDESKAPALRAELFVLLLALLSAGLLIFELVAELAPHQRAILERVDLVIAFTSGTDRPRTDLVLPLLGRIR